MVNMSDSGLVIQNGTLIDGTGTTPIANATVVIRAGKIAQVVTGPTVSPPEGAQVINADGKFIMPGLWDTHIHIGGSAGGFASQEEFSPEQFELNWRAYLYNGVTSVLDVCGAKDSVLEWRKSERKGSLLGPRVFAVGPGFTAPGGHPAGTIYMGNEWLIEQATRQVDDPEPARDKVRELAADGVDAIKAMYDDVGGMVPKLSLKVLQAIIDEAHKHDTRVFVHVRNAQDAMDALNAGADGIEHIVGSDESACEQALQLAARKDAFWTPTLAVMEAQASMGDMAYLESFQTQGSVSGVVLESIKQLWQNAGTERFQRLEPCLESVRRLRELGVRVALGTDAGNPAVFHGLALHRELELMVRAGYSPIEAIVAATKTAAEKLGVEPDYGTVEQGKTADMVILSADPLQDISNTHKIEVVIKGGVVHKREELVIKGDVVLKHEEPLIQPDEPIRTDTDRPDQVQPLAPAEAGQPIGVQRARELIDEATRLFHDASGADDYSRAKDILQAAQAGLLGLTEREPESATAYYWLAQAQSDLGQLSLVENKDWQVQADQRTATNYLEAAWESVKRAVELDEQLGDGHRLTSDVIGRLVALKGWQFAAAQGPRMRKAAERALELDSNNALAHMALGRQCLFTPRVFGGDTEKAVRAFQEAIEVAATDHERFLGHAWLGQAMLKKKQKSQARAEFEQALSYYPNSNWVKALLKEAG